MLTRAIRALSMAPMASTTTGLRCGSPAIGAVRSSDPAAVSMPVTSSTVAPVASVYGRVSSRLTWQLGTIIRRLAASVAPAASSAAARAPVIASGTLLNLLNGKNPGRAWTWTASGASSRVLSAKPAYGGSASWARSRGPANGV